MQENPLQQLRDVHLPLEPGWWPPAPGWWILICLCIVQRQFFILGQNMWRAHQRKRPIRSARALLEERLSDYRLGQIGALEYVNHANEILKRLLVIAFDIKSLAATSNEDWLGALESHFQQHRFQPKLRLRLRPRTIRSSSNDGHRSFTPMH